jgi:hypothetical protein
MIAEYCVPDRSSASRSAMQASLAALATEAAEAQSPFFTIPAQ